MRLRIQPVGHFLTAYMPEHVTEIRDGFDSEAINMLPCDGTHCGSMQKAAIVRYCMRCRHTQRLPDTRRQRLTTYRQLVGDDTFGEIGNQLRQRLAANSVGITLRRHLEIVLRIRGVVVWSKYVRNNAQLSTSSHELFRTSWPSLLQHRH